MAKVELGSSYSNFLQEKGIQRAYNFIVNFHNMSVGTSRGTVSIDKFQIPGHGGTPVRTIRPAHVKNITLPSYQFKSEGHNFGPFLRAIPVLEKQPLSINMELEEDDEHTIGYFIQYLQNQVMNEYGVYRPVWSNDNRKKLKIVIQIFKPDGTKVVDYAYYNCYLQTVSETTYDYTSNNAISNTLAFNADYYSTKYYNKPPAPTPIPLNKLEGYGNMPKNPYVFGTPVEPLPDFDAPSLPDWQGQ